MKSHMLVRNAEEHLKSFPLYKTTREYIVENGRLLVKLAERALGSECHISFIGKLNLSSKIFLIHITILSFAKSTKILDIL